MRVFKQSSILLINLRAYSSISRFQTHSLPKSPNNLEPRISQTGTHLRFKTLPNVNLLHYLSTKSGKLFQETENEYAHFIMEKSGYYSHSLLKFPLKTGVYLRSKEPVEQLNSFSKFAKVTVGNCDGSSLENKEFSSLVKDLSFSLYQASDDEVQSTLHYLCMWPSTAATYTPHFKALWNTLDHECLKRMKNWNVSRKLLIADYWFCLRLSRISQFNRELIFNMLGNCETLTNRELVQLMFYINLQRQLPNALLGSLERKLEIIIDSISVDEVGIICLAYFKTKNKISSVNVIQSIFRHLLTNLETVNTVTVAAILKCLRKSLNQSLIDVYISALHKCIPYVKNWDIPTSVHLALLSAECNVYHPLLLDNVSDKLTKEINQSRIKDCVKLLHCLAHFNHYYAREFHNAVFAEIRKDGRQKEVNLYPKDLVFLTLYSAYIGHFDHKLLSQIFHKEFLGWCCSNYPDILPAYAEIDYCIEIECQSYSGPKFDLLQRKMLKTRRGNLPSNSKYQNMQTRLTADVYECLVEMLGTSKNVLIRHILPHAYSPDIIVRLQNKTKNSLTEICNNIPSDVVLVPPKNEAWACFVACGTFSFAYRSKQMTGITAMKLRQLQKLGYHVIFIPFYDLPQNLFLRRKFLKEQLSVLEEKHDKHVC